ncbi:hypothetical protein [Alicyclobacillus herbarius]|uniref:hypothetical protein n=1 Tax=Alicyclobacillus herbarius TaxID=122960 RepID=UPI000405153B|nr:hypothetical protein [Alicyclobacillus herbarius]
MAVGLQGAHHSRCVAAPDDWLRDYTVLTHSHPEYWDDLLLALRRLYPAIRTVMWQ